MSHLITFPFTFVDESEMGFIYRPYGIVEIFSRSRKKWQPIEVLFDSGADYTLLPGSYASLLGIDLVRDCKKTTSIGVGGTEAVFQYPRLLIKIGRWQTHIPVGFLDRTDIPALLGRLHCLEDLSITFASHKSILGTDK